MSTRREYRSTSLPLWLAQKIIENSTNLVTRDISGHSPSQEMFLFKEFLCTMSVRAELHRERAAPGASGWRIRAQAAGDTGDIQHVAIDTQESALNTE